jgi:TetR/AcrR family transcriptional regulator, regulator of biofilm formation and stress response
MPRPSAEVRRGVSRLEAILEATLTLIGERGLEAVTHRTVAREAGVSLGAISHHFPSRQALLEATLEHAGRAEVRRLEDLALDLQTRLFDTEEWIDAMAAALARDLSRSRTRHLAQYELLLTSARNARIRELARAWRSAHLQVASVGIRAAGSNKPEVHGPLLVAAITGLLLKQLADPQPRFELDILRPQLGELVRGLTKPSST